MDPNFNELENPDIRTENRPKPKRRILFVITQSELGGAQQFLAYLLKALNPNQYELAVVLGSDGNEEIVRKFSENITIFRSRHLKRNPSVWDDIRSLFELKRMILGYKPNILFLNSSKAGFNGSWAAKMASRALPNMKVFYRIGGWSFNDPRPEWQKLAFQYLERFSAGWKDYIIVNNKYDLNLAHRLKIKPRKELLLIHNGIDPYLEFMDREEAKVKLFDQIARQNTGKDKGGQASFLHADMIVGTIANFYPTKDLLTFIRAAHKTEGNIVFVIIGGGEMQSQIEAEIKQLGLEKRVFLAGKLFDAYRYLPAFDIFVLSSVKEGFPWVVLEAMAAKVPVIATRVGAIPEIIENNAEGIVVEPKNPEQIAEAITRLTKDDRLRQETSIRAHQKLIKQFTLRQMADKYEKLFS